MEFLVELRDLLQKHKVSIVADNFWGGKLTLEIQFQGDKDTIKLDTTCDSQDLDKMIEDMSDG